ncbi:Csa1p NDAI_0J00300 [Naumovozyma dairenensis CBS 421]|uniref:Uncharacterized protein n=1 Tax=Naumovozyma dairenensis (strain ATCC 10597 / BCRC 20456 / CBS 421 / NBRC 0211 / NRRL Y-12639) TaxID=1071378 RepID=G0WGJ4_NAUDC|nr:hypothetical protein NDAI_0J00300 [Naumovozyma dairenensis CBS 421]CCD26922.1 hypothetical protein NDAI_0J00300 [Naumovozyma dairenensis CBS 421]
MVFNSIKQYLGFDIRSGKGSQDLQAENAVTTLRRKKTRTRDGKRQKGYRGNHKRHTRGTDNHHHGTVFDYMKSFFVNDVKTRTDTHTQRPFTRRDLLNSAKRERKREKLKRKRQLLKERVLREEALKRERLHHQEEVKVSPTDEGDKANEDDEVEVGDITMERIEIDQNTNHIDNNSNGDDDSMSSAAAASRAMSKRYSSSPINRRNIDDKDEQLRRLERQVEKMGSRINGLVRDLKFAQERNALYQTLLDESNIDGGYVKSRRDMKNIEKDNIKPQMQDQQLLLSPRRALNPLVTSSPLRQQPNCPPPPPKEIPSTETLPRPSL